MLAEHPGTFNTLHNLAALYMEQGKYVQAEPILERLLNIQEHQLGAKHPDTVRCLHNLVILYFEQGKYDQFIQRLERLLSIQLEYFRN